MKRTHWAWLATVVVACAGSPKINVGDEPDGSFAGSGGTGFGAGGQGARDAGIGSVDEALRVRVEDVDEVVLEVVTIACAGDCVTLRAVASGGVPPYTYAWEDGSVDATRTLCPEQASVYSVSATDTGYFDSEFKLPQVATQELSAQVLDCAADGGSPRSDELCITNSSFEGVVTPSQLENIDAPPWNGCYVGGIARVGIGDPTLWSHQNWSFPEASDGETYATLAAGSFGVGTVTQALCAPIRAGETRSFQVDLASVECSEACSPTVDHLVEVVGGTACAENVVLWTSPELPTEWRTYCVTITPTQDISNLAFRAKTTLGGLMQAAVDNIVPVEACP